MRYLFTDIMRDIVWPFYHKWFIHKGRLPHWLTHDEHMNPYYILTPRLLKRQCERHLRTIERRRYEEERS